MDGHAVPGTVPHQWRSSKAFICIVVNLAAFIDSYLYSLIIPILPFSLIEIVEIQEDEIQFWIGALVAAYGAGLLVGSRET